MQLVPRGPLASGSPTALHSDDDAVDDCSGDDGGDTQPHGDDDVQQASHILTALLIKPRLRASISATSLPNAQRARPLPSKKEQERAMRTASAAFPKIAGKRRPRPSISDGRGRRRTARRIQRLIEREQSVHALVSHEEQGDRSRAGVGTDDAADIADLDPVLQRRNLRLDQMRDLERVIQAI